MSSKVSKTETVEQESDTYQHEQNKECDGDELCRSQGRGQRWFSRELVSSAEWEDTEQIDAGRNAKGTGGKGDWETGKGGSKGKEWSKGEWSNLVTRGTVRGTIPSGTAKRMVLRWIRGRLLNLFPICVQSVGTQVARISLNRNACREEHTPKLLSLGVQRILLICLFFDSCAGRQRVSWSVELQNTRQGFRVSSGDAVMNELMNALQLLRHKFPVSEDPVHRS